MIGWILLGILAFIVIVLHFSVRAELTASKKGVKIEAGWLFFKIYPRNKKKKSKPAHDSQNDIDYEEFDDTDDFSDSLEDELDDTADLCDVSDDYNKENVSEEVHKVDLKKEEPENENVSDDKPENSDKADDTADNPDEDEDEESNDKSEDKDGRKTKSDKPAKVKKEKKEKKEGKLDKYKRKYRKIKPYIPTGWKAVKKLLKSIRFDIDLRIKAGNEDAYKSAMNYGKIQSALFNFLGVISGVFTVKIKRADVNCVFNRNVFAFKTKVTVRIRPSTIIAIAVCTLVNFVIIFFRQKRMAKKRRKMRELKKMQRSKNLEKR